MSSSKRDERLEALHNTLADSVGALTTSDAWRDWLATASKFHTYSFNNTMLILAQRPTATMVAGYGKWQEMGRQVRKGEKSIGIFAPMMRKRTDETTGEEKRFVSGFRVVSVFDVSQTEGDPLPERPAPELLDGEAPAGLWDALAGIVLDKGYTIERGDCGGANGVTMPAIKTVRVREDVSDAQACKTLAHELAHVMLHTDGEDLAADLHRGTAEVEAESVSYMVANMHGLDTSAYTFPYVGAWGGEDVEKTIRATADRVLKTVRLIVGVTLAEVGEPAPVPA